MLVCGVGVRVQQADRHRGDARLPHRGDRVLHVTGGEPREHEGRGKRGGTRIIYYRLVAEDQIYLFTVYSKGLKDDLSPAERASWRKVVEEIKHS